MEVIDDNSETISEKTNGVSTNALVSVIIPTYQRFDEVQAAINSVLQQDYPHVEVIVVNDASPDLRYFTLEFIYWRSMNVRIVHLGKNMRAVHNTKCAQGATRMAGVQQAKGQYLAFLDDDDKWTDRRKLSKQLAVMTSASHSGQIKLSCTNMWRGSGLNTTQSDQNHQIIEPYFTKQIGRPCHNVMDDEKKKNNDHTVLTLQDIAIDNLINNSTVVVERVHFEASGGQRAEDLEDFRCWQRMLQKFNAVYFPEPMVWYNASVQQQKHYKYQ